MPSAFSTVGLNSEVDVLYNEESATLLRRNGDLFTGFSYSTVSQLPTATKAELQGSTSGDGPGDEYLSLPDDFPEELRTLAHQRFRSRLSVPRPMSRKVGSGVGTPASGTVGARFP